jgi:hypothetical protein
MRLPVTLVPERICGIHGGAMQECQTRDQSKKRRMKKKIENHHKISVHN